MGRGGLQLYCFCDRPCFRAFAAFGGGVEGQKMVMDMAQKDVDKIDIRWLVGEVREWVRRSRSEGFRASLACLVED